MNIQILLEKPKDKIVLALFIATFIGVIICLAIFAPFLAQFPKGGGLYDIKGAWNKINLDKVIDTWEKDGQLNHYVTLMFLVHVVDLGFMAVYGTAVFTALLLVARWLEGHEKLQQFYLKLSVFSWLAIIFDLIEQIFILIILLNPHNITDSVAFGASISTTLCIIVLYSCILIWLAGLLIVLIFKIKDK